jgi:predicted tellurium resistance membrane protein TerC
VSAWLSTANGVALLTLTALEIVLGIDNVIFIAIVVGRLPTAERGRARTLGISLAVVTRILLLIGITWIMRLTTPLFHVFGNDISGRDLILIVGGLFLIGKSTHEIHDKLESADLDPARKVTATGLGAVLIQIMLLDVIFSLDSVITAVGLSGNLPVMVTAIVLAAAVMVFFAGAVSRFVEQHPTMKILALSFLILIGVLLVMEGWNQALAEGLNLRAYAYFAMAYAFAVELLNLRVRHPGVEPVHLRTASLPTDPDRKA